jgi:plasmid stabilization system protein ParE
MPVPHPPNTRSDTAAVPGQLYRYISSENPEAARKVINDIYETGNKIKAFPAIGRIVPEIRRNNIREVFCFEYRIIYRIGSRRIFILTVRHMKQRSKKKDIAGDAYTNIIRIPSVSSVYQGAVK